MKTLITIVAAMTMLTCCAPNTKKGSPEPKDTIVQPDTNPVIYRRYVDDQGLIWYQEETK